MYLPNRPEPSATAAPLDAARALRKLKRIHAELIDALEEMEIATQAPSPDMSDYSHARWKLGAASRNRRSLVGKLCHQLMALADPEDAQVLKELYSDDMRMLRESAAHVGTWSLDMIETRWSDYCQASREIRAKMIERIEIERRRLIPILERAA